MPDSHVPPRRLDLLLRESTTHFPQRRAVIDPECGAVTYSELLAAVDAIAAALSSIGVSESDRVGICAPKSVGVVASIFGILTAKAGYVPVDPTAPPARSAYIFDDCRVSAVIIDRTLLPGINAALQNCRLEPIADVHVAPATVRNLLIAKAIPRSVHAQDDPPKVADLAYILYTSGSTGKPKGVIHNHASALSFIDWCTDEFSPRVDDVFSSHAPFHFDLSIFDLYVPIKHGAAVVIIGEDTGKNPQQLATLIAQYAISIWYSTPSILRLLVEFGKLERFKYDSLRLVLYAGEVFPVKHQRTLRSIWPGPIYYNLYGPTETNVCTFDQVANVDDAQGGAFCIGKVCSGDRGRVIDPDGQDVTRGEEGELVIAGGSVMLGYWNLPENNSRAFLLDDENIAWYRTGDLVVEQPDHSFLFHGRRDRMVKRRGYRVELGEIEAAMYRHEKITEAAAIALPDNESGVLIKLFHNWAGDGKPSTIDLKSFASKNLPAYMVPDRFVVLADLPKTSTDKIDYQKLKEMD
jgi:amino acid adenylation domain-containing protein